MDVVKREEGAVEDEELRPGLICVSSVRHAKNVHLCS